MRGSSPRAWLWQRNGDTKARRNSHHSPFGARDGPRGGTRDAMDAACAQLELAVATRRLSRPFCAGRLGHDVRHGRERGQLPWLPLLGPRASRAAWATGSARRGAASSAPAASSVSRRAASSAPPHRRPRAEAALGRLKHGPAYTAYGVASSSSCPRAPCLGRELRAPRRP